nr:hypothetical protein [Tanacetum cinerariifolium]
MSRVTTRILEKLLGDEGPSSGGTKLNSTFITVEEKTWDREDTKEVFTISHERPNHYTSEDNGEGLRWSKRTKRVNILGRNSNKKQKKEAEGSIVKKFFGQGEQVYETLDANEWGTFNLNKKLQAKSTPTPRAWRLYLGKETIKEGLGVGIIRVSLKKRTHAYAIYLKFNTFDHTIDCEALLAGLAASIRKGMKDLHVFMDLPKLVSQTEGNHMPATEQERKYKKEIIDAIALSTGSRSCIFQKF